MLLFLGWLEALIVSGTVPVIFSITLGADLLGGVTINRITLFALILALGLLVDASIVVIENIHRHYHGHSTAAKERSEEHTSELQSLMRISYAVFCLKQKNKTKQSKKDQHQR